MVGQKIQRTRKTARSYSTEKTNRFDACKFDFELGQWSDRFRDIEENVLFVGKMGSMSISACDNARGDSNTIYFVDNCVGALGGRGPMGFLHMGVFNLKTRTFEHSVATFKYRLRLTWLSLLLGAPVSGLSRMHNLNPKSLTCFARNHITTDGINTGPKWEKLPSDLLLKIQEKLNIFDKTRLYCVCKPWKSAMSKAHRSQLVPFLFLPPQLYKGSCRFYDLVDKRSYSLKAAQGKSFYFKGSRYGWVVSVIEFGPHICLINPLTGLQKQLPNVTWQGLFVTDKYVVSSNPSLNDDCFVVAIYGKFSSLAYTRCGDDTWTNIKSDKRFIDIAFYEGELYGLTRNLELMHVKIFSSGSQVTQISPLVDHESRHGFYTFLVESSIGLLMVERTVERPAEEAQDHERSLRKYTTGFCVYKFEFELGQWSDRLADIGENVLFVGRICSMSVPSIDCPNGFSNTICFVDNCIVAPLDTIGCLHMGVFNLETETVEHSVATIEFDLQFAWPWPIWVAPSC